MSCQTCNDFAEIQAVVARMKPKVPGPAWCINAFLAWHLSVVHGAGYQDLGVYTSRDAPGSEAVDTPRASGV